MYESKSVVALRSKEWIVKAFFSLLETENYTDVTISEIAAKADLDRRTFYRHFKSKEEVITYYIEKSSEEYEIALSKHMVYDNRTIAKSIFSVCCNQKKFLLILKKQNLTHHLLSELNKIFIKYQSKYATTEELEEPNREYILAYHIGGFWNLILKWLSSSHEENPDEMADIIVQILENRQI